MTSENYRPGEPLTNIRHETLNAADCFLAYQQQGRFESAAILDSEPQGANLENCVTMKNRTGQVLNQGDVVGIGPPLYDMSTQYGEESFENDPYLTAEIYDQERHGCCFGIVRQGSGDECDVEICMAGLVCARIIVNEMTHRYVRPVTGELRCLETVEDCGCARIMHVVDYIVQDEKGKAIIRFEESPCGEDDQPDLCPNGCRPNTIICGTIEADEPPPGVPPVENIEPGDTFNVTYTDCDGNQKTITQTNTSNDPLQSGSQTVIFVTDDCQLKVPCCVFGDQIDCTECFQNLADNQSSLSVTITNSQVSFPESPPPGNTIEWSPNPYNYDGTYTFSNLQYFPQTIRQLSAPDCDPNITTVTRNLPAGGFVRRGYYLCPCDLEVNCSQDAIEIIFRMQWHGSPDFGINEPPPPLPWPEVNGCKMAYHTTRAVANPGGPPTIPPAAVYTGCGKYSVFLSQDFGTSPQFGSVCVPFEGLSQSWEEFFPTAGGDVCIDISGN